jgi:hypothetical protein
VTAPTVTRCPHAGCGWQAHSQHDGPLHLMAHLRTAHPAPEAWVKRALTIPQTRRPRP